MEWKREVFPKPMISGKIRSRSSRGVEDEIEAFRNVLSSGSSCEAKFNFYRMLHELSAEAAPQMIGLMAELNAEGHALDTVGNLFWQRWGEIDGEAAQDDFPEIHEGL